MSAPFRRVLANLSQGAQTVAPAPTAPHQQHPGGTNEPAVPAVAPIAQAVAPVADEAAEALRRIGLDETEIATYPDRPSIFQRFDAIHETLERVAALLAAQHSKPPIFQALYIGANQSQSVKIRTHGRKYVGISAGGSTATGNLLIGTLTGAMNFALAINWNFFLLPDGTEIWAKAAADAGNYEFVYTDDIGGNVLAG